MKSLYINMEDLVSLDSEGMCLPKHFDSKTLLTRTLALVEHLNKCLRSEPVKYWLDQDSTRFAGIRIPCGSLGTTRSIDIDVSCFGGMVLISGSGTLSTEAHSLLCNAVAIAGLRLLPEEIADQPCTGSGSNIDGLTWRQRFFDYY